ncbi:iron export ABC transporter permease subunit FetB [Lactobacillus sp. CC-MHH1034]|uniref:ABC transporter permease n=1 Tax=Agrilactobacillus fermenti TaxID=2586909 RepID=UPI001E3C869E|nr:iron export ABC transporter permease subunit FetB [Agrilactobacillus fermenti]MCD2257430.1 iron export ABC transporter permease subunit FetB [Agrilactobacillus fermenti]
MHNLQVSNMTLLLSGLLVLIALLLSYRQRIGLEKDMIIGVIRAVIQLFIVGYVLKYLFRVNNVWLTLAMLLVIIINAAWNTKKRADHISHAFEISLLAIFASTGVTLGVLVISGSIKFIPAQMIPITGMIASNTMVAIGLCYRNMNQSFADQRQQVLEKLALGADLHLASLSLIKAAIKTGMSPTIDSAKTVGLVSLPGMMSGLIFAGVDPLHAIQYQIMVTFMLMSATSIGSVIACYLGYRSFYNDQKQLL